MSTTATPFGLRVASHQSATAKPKAIDGGISSGYASSIYFGAPVTLATSGVLAIATTTSLLCGIFVGCRYQPTATDMYTETPYWPASTTYVAGSMTAYIMGFDDPMLMYEMQANGSLTQASIGDQAAAVNPSSGNTLGFSLCTLNSSLVGATNTGQFRILDVAPRPDNAWGDSFTRVYVQIAGHQFYSQATAI